MFSKLPRPRKPRDTTKDPAELRFALALTDVAAGRSPTAQFDVEQGHAAREMEFSDSLPTKVNHGVDVPQEVRDEIGISLGGTRTEWGIHMPDNKYTALRDAIADKRRELTEEVLVAWGFRLGKPFKDDKMFRPAALPPGWRKSGTGHTMWTHVYDEYDRERLSLFYKSAFYDRDAFLNLVPRFKTYADIPAYREKTVDIPRDQMETFGVVTDGGEEIFRSEAFSYATYEGSEKAEAAAKAWAEENLPEGWNDLVKGWEVEYP